MHIIENESLRIAVKQTGAELSSIQSKSSGIEYLWQGDPEVWAGQAPVLFPIVGGLKDSTYFYKGKTYSLPKHGFVRYNKQVALVDKTDESLTFSLKSDKTLLAQYPFLFELEIAFFLKGNQIQVEHEVRNTGESEMLFSLGGHPAFRCRLHEGERYEDYYLQFEQSETAHTWDLNPEGLITNQGRLVLDDSHQLDLHDHLFDHDALIFKGLNSTSVSLRSRKSSQELRVDFEGWPYLGIWAKPRAPYVCIEPWLGIADSAGTDQQLESKEGIIRLDSGEIFRAGYSIRITE